MKRTDKQTGDVELFGSDGMQLMPRAELKIVLLYIVGASLWTLGADMLLDWLENDPIDTIRLHTLKAINLIATSAVLLFLVLQRSYNRWHRAENKLVESEQRFAYAARASTDAIWDLNLVTHDIWWSAGFQKLFGYGPAEVGSTLASWTSRLHPQDRARAESGLRQVIESGGEVWRDEYRFQRKDGSYAHVVDRGFVIHDAAGKSVRMVGGMSDITARKDAEEKLDRSHRQLRALSAKLQNLREEERSRIAREIHDELGQMLTGLKMDLRWIERRLSQSTDATLNPLLDKVVEAGELADATINSVQRISSDLRPGVLDNLGLVAAVRQEAARFQERTGVTCRLTCPEESPSLPRDTTTAAFRIFQEALTNVTRHAQASDVSVELDLEGAELSLDITDNGRGIQPADLEDPKSLGLLGMKERAQILDGELTVTPRPGGGTLVHLRLPLPAATPPRTPVFA